MSRLFNRILLEPGFDLADSDIHSLGVAWQGSQAELLMEASYVFVERFKQKSMDTCLSGYVDQLMQEMNLLGACSEEVHSSVRNCVY